MFTFFAHAGHAHDTEVMNMLDHCLPTVIGAGIIIAVLLATIIYLVINWQPKNKNTPKNTKVIKK